MEVHRCSEITRAQQCSQAGTNTYIGICVRIKCGKMYRISDIFLSLGRLVVCPLACICIEYKTEISSDA